MSKKVIGLVALGAVLFAHCLPAEAQQRTKIPRIGYLGSVSKSDRTETFRQGLRELGYLEGKNIFIEWRHHERNIDRLPALATELVRLKVEIIITAGAPAARAAKGATTTISIVMTQIGDPVASGFVASLAHPGGNITGLSTLAPELNGKRLEILKEVIPGLSRVGIFGSSTSPDNAPSLKEVELAAKALKLELRYFDILSPKDFESAFRAATKDRAQGALMMALGTFSSSRRKEIVDLAVKSRLPVIYTGPAMVETGGLMTYGVDNTHLDRRAAMYVDKILKGAKPADLPVEQPKKFEFVVNLKSAKQIGLTIPPNVLVRADRVIR
jgi:putative ABC transport system substrate-binding protein